jgi:putative aldouronate transport system substrate-binding protein
VNGVGDWLQQGNDRSAYGISKVYLDEGQYVKDAMWGAPTPTLQAAGSTLNDILIEGFTKIIVGEKDIDYFDELVEQWKTAGGSQATQEINDTYGK